MADYLDYLAPPDESEVALGVRVLVPFGSRQLVGVLLERAPESELPREKLKPVMAVLDQTPVLTVSVRQLCEFTARYYHAPLGEVILAALPKRLRLGKALPDESDLLKLKPKPSSSASLSTSLSMPLELNNEQAAVLAACLACPQAQYQCYVLAGVTGSGKTEVYLQLIAAHLAKQRQVLILVPEISLTPQTIARVVQRFSVPVAVMHSQLSEKQRAVMWLAAKTGLARIVIGTRSAIFSPLENLGLIIVDEEHDASFKSQQSPGYSARDLAVFRARQLGIPVVLGSATPSLETYFNAQHGRYTWLRLTQRAGEARPPKIDWVDLRGQRLTAGLTPLVLESIQAYLLQKRQILLFINRRGFAPVWMCHACGQCSECRRCDARLTLHQMPFRLHCHHCEYQQKPPKICPHCHQAEMFALGQGTEQIESSLVDLFPKARILRIDRDTTRKKEALAEKLDEIHAGEADIIVGTQMLAKGHHFPNLGLCVILDVDQALFSVDFRALERLAQLLVQVAGRAGRAGPAGRADGVEAHQSAESLVMIQTHHPDHPVLTGLFQSVYEEFLQTSLASRQAAALPPYRFQAILRAQAKQKALAHDFLIAAKAAFAHSTIELYGPIPAWMERRAGTYRQQLLLQSHNRQQLAAELADVMPRLAKLPLARRVRYVIDVDPLEL
jgi:primosomal protein N' (replication factor Y)